ncbi:unnamed protein product [Oppiella nova]|uniref:Uncharacterized protein n=1 Tax=Oppiella nova TaxID=334625 RepID=A0A7R9LXG4_9ACAR|nr:unnamed protein product [Oppiella nova]CAG2167230.1 unnamed protein product [Oppiella nova]
MVLKRAAIAKQSGLPCYDQFYQKYTKGLANIFMEEQETKRLDTARTPQERSDAVKDVADITVAMICDENWRAVHFNDTIKEAECSALESTAVLDLVDFKPKLANLESGLLFASIASQLNNNVMSGIFGEITKLYGQLYKEGEQCSLSLRNPSDKCHNLKMFVKEINRLFYLAEIKALSLL